MKPDDLIRDTGLTNHVVRDRAVVSSFESWKEGTSVKNPTASCQRFRVKDQWKWRSGTAMILRGATLLFTGYPEELLIE